MSGPAQPVVPAPPQGEPEPARSRGVVALLVAVVVGLLGVALAAGLLSFDSIEALARLLGYAPDRAWLLPVCLDVASVVAGVVWLAGHMIGARRSLPFARVLCLATLGLSVVANGVGHGLDAYEVTRPHWVLVVVASAVPPAVLGAVVHLAVLVLGDLRAGPEREPEGSDRDEDPRPCSDWSDDALADDLRRWAADPSRPAPSRDRVVAAYGIGAKRAAKLREMAGVGTEPVPMRVVGGRPTAGAEGSA